MSNDVVIVDSSSSDSPDSDLPPIVHRPASRPFGFNPIAGPDNLRIYLLTAKSFRVNKGDSQSLVAEMTTHRVYGIARILSSLWMLALCWVIGWVAASLGSPEIQWGAYSIGALATLTFGAVMVFDYLQTLRLPKKIVAMHNDGKLVFFDGQQTLSDYQSLSLRTRWSYTRPPSQGGGSSTCTLDLVVTLGGREHLYQLAATSGAELGQLARQFSIATGIPMKG